jgi:hypothetical protein
MTIDTTKQKKLIGSIYLEVITGDIHIKNQYINTLVTHISVCLKTEKLSQNQHPIEIFRTRLHNAISMILRNNFPLPLHDETRESEIQKMEKLVEKYVIRIDTSKIDPQSIEQIGIIEDIETLEYCRNICYVAAADYASSLTGSRDGLTDATNKYSVVINMITPIVYRYNMVEISDVEFSNAARVAAKRAEMGGNRA